MEGSAYPFFMGSWYSSPVTSRNSLVYLKNLRVAAIPGTSTTYVPDKYLEGKKLYIIFSCLFYQISYLNYASFCLSYQDGLNDIGKNIVKLAVYPAHVIHMCQKIMYRWYSNCTVCLLNKRWATQTKIIHHFYNNQIWWFWAFWTIFMVHD